MPDGVTINFSNVAKNMGSVATCLLMVAHDVYTGQTHLM